MKQYAVIDITKLFPSGVPLHQVRKWQSEIVEALDVGYTFFRYAPYQKDSPLKTSDVVINELLIAGRVVVLRNKTPDWEV